MLFLSRVSAAELEVLVLLPLAEYYLSYHQRIILWTQFSVPYELNSRYLPTKPTVIHVRRRAIFLFSKTITKKKKEERKWFSPLVQNSRGTLVQFLEVRASPEDSFLLYPISSSCWNIWSFSSSRCWCSSFARSRDLHAQEESKGLTTNSGKQRYLFPRK